MPAIKGSVRGAKQALLDEDVVVEMIADGFTQNQIAQHFKVSRGVLRHWICADLARAARAREASVQAAQAFAEGAYTVLMDAADPFALAKAREISSHLRWAASKANSATYGDKQQIDVAVTMTQEQVDAKLAALVAKL